MKKSEINIEEVEPEVIAYTLRGVPIWVHNEVASFQREISYKLDKKFNLEQTYTEALVEWATARKEKQPTA